MTGLPVTIRPEAPGEERAVEDVQREAFGESGPRVAELVASLRTLIAARGGFSLVAEHDETGEILGHVMFSRGWLDAPRQLVDVDVLSPLGVRPAHQRRGIGGLLVRAGIERAAEDGAPAVLLEGSPVYYSRFGFRPGAEQGFQKPSVRIPDAAFQSILLPAHEPWMTGALVYADAFWRCDSVGLRDPSLF